MVIKKQTKYHIDLVRPRVEMEWAFSHRVVSLQISGMMMMIIIIVIVIIIIIIIIIPSSPSSSLLLIECFCCESSLVETRQSHSPSCLSFPFFFFFLFIFFFNVDWLCDLTVLEIVCRCVRWMHWYSWMLILIPWLYVWVSFLVRSLSECNVLLYSA